MPGTSVSFPDHDARAAALESAVRAKARELGFDAVGIARADVSLDRDMARREAFARDRTRGDVEVPGGGSRS